MSMLETKNNCFSAAVGEQCICHTFFHFSNQTDLPTPIQFAHHLSNARHVRKHVKISHPVIENKYKKATCNMTVINQL